MGDKIEIKQSGLQCDNKKCDWKDLSIPHTDYEKYIDFPCPKCGENVLTEHDYSLSVIFHNAVDLVNSMTEEEQDTILKAIGADITDNTIRRVKVGLHNEITFEEDATERGDKDSHN